MHQQPAEKHHPQWNLKVWRTKLPLVDGTPVQECKLALFHHYASLFYSPLNLFRTISCFFFLHIQPFFIPLNCFVVSLLAHCFYSIEYYLIDCFRIKAPKVPICTEFQHVQTEIKRQKPRLMHRWGKISFPVSYRGSGRTRYIGI